MVPSSRYDAVIIGAGPNGLSAAIQFAKQGLSVLVFEARETVGGGTRSEERTLPGFIHDVCSAIHPLGFASPFFRSLPLKEYGLEWVHPPVPLAHPLEDGRAALLHRDLQKTAQEFGDDGPAYLRLMRPFVQAWDGLFNDLLGPLRIPRHPILFARFGLLALLSAQRIGKTRFRHQPARALWSGMAGHSMMPLEKLGTGAFGLTLGVLGHAVGWPIAKGGSHSITDALAQYLLSLGGEIVTNRRITSLDELPPAQIVMFNLTPRQILSIAGESLPSGFRRQLGHFRYGPGVFKIDWALDGPIPWKAEGCALAGTVHLGGTMEEIARAERSVGQGDHPERPYVLLAQQSLFDPMRAPEGKHTAWAYCHVPNGSVVDMTTRIEAQVERFAPGFQDRILARATYNAQEMETYNPNYVGGDINGGLQDLRQQFARPTPRLVPYKLPGDGLYICSSSTPPGGGVHGMCGYFAARAAMRALKG
jgi:phytoene dehydrogenase-like protein